ncbi:MAG: 4-hydroxy-3-methylbut-2-enyl diphosphate reductase [Bacteroidetes bacterium]|nr:4-hydroxy-3-methylbut-2-enyl diphosphate reductase [Bacteroidota bacterium]MCL2303039.1 4-hydroxy-3-methylbut-2-enyl diphosphate reductase [Lentimicrobiaceae bacterium]
MTITIDKNSGFCFGVIHAIRTAEQYLQQHHSLYCLGDIVHNNEEVSRLTDLGLKIITPEQFKNLHNTTVLIRAHGEPPATYQIAKKNSITLIDATCQVVSQLQKKIKTEVEQHPEIQILIVGKAGHAEVEGLLGQTQQNGQVVSSIQDLEHIDYSKPAKLYAQTTQSAEKYGEIAEKIRENYRKKDNAHLLEIHNTICKRVSNRADEIATFASQFDAILFVSDEKSSNGLFLYEVCKKQNPNTYFISSENQLQHIDFKDYKTIGICGATSTPIWLMQKIAENARR